MQGRRHLKIDLRVVDQSMVNLLQAGGTFGRSRNTKRHAHRLVLFDVGVLTHDHDFEIAELGLCEGVKDELLRWVARALLILTLHKAVEAAEGCRIQVS